MNEYNGISQGLLKRRRELQIRIDKLKKDGDDPLNMDSEEQAIELESSEVQSAIYEGAFKEIAQINKILDMIEKNEYGKCIECGEQIPVKRLEAIPHASYCVDCAASK
ncbi:MAG: TraR/DksA family transcriptional regulator [Deltaproteobacteria bacterium]|nr:TraR/DksA family transcriptional regulator [Deltaproteobacteria bacterium]